jgi:hypothetical protein
VCDPDFDRQITKENTTFGRPLDRFCDQTMTVELVARR